MLSVQACLSFSPLFGCFCVFVRAYIPYVPNIVTLFQSLESKGWQDSSRGNF